MKFYVRKIQEDYSIIDYPVGDYVLIGASGRNNNLIDIVDFWSSEYEAAEVYLDDEVYVVYK